MERLKKRLTEVVVEKAAEENEAKYPYEVDIHEMPKKKTKILNYKLYQPYLVDTAVREK